MTDRRPPLLWLVAVACAVAAFLSEASAQDRVVLPPRWHWDHYNTHDVFSARIHAEADLVRAQGQAAVSFAEARRIHAAAYSQELENWVDEVRARWSREAEAERGRLALNHVRQIRRLEYLNDRKWQNNRTWDRLRNHPELGDVSIENGTALNFLLDRLGASALPYEFDPSTSRFGPDVIEQLQLDADTLSHITLQQGSYSFPANQSLQEDLLWPYLLRWDDFRFQREDYEKARKIVIEESIADGQVSVAAVGKLSEALMELTNRFHRSTRVRDWVRANIRYSQFQACDRFLWKLDREIVQLEETGDLRPFQGRRGYDPQTDGDHVLSLLCFMNRNGLEFAPPTPGSEFAYHDLFAQMRAIYLTVDDQDESTQPQDLRELAE